MPLFGYALMIGAVAGLLAVTYAVAGWMASRGNYFLTGFFPILLYVFICFVAVCLFDAAFDRISGRIKRSKESEPGE
jgi:hypothetical protein